MFSIETTEDIKLLKELTGFSNDSKIQELESEIGKLREENIQLKQLSQQHVAVIDDLKNNLITAEQCRGIVFDLLENKSNPKNLNSKKKISILKSDTDEFDVTKSMKRKFNKIIVNGNNLIHHTVRNQKMPLPVSTLELLALLEIYQHRKRILLNKDSEKICKLYNINKVQFGKLYYNLKEGVFFDAFEEIDKQIKRTNFKVINGLIHIIEGGRSINTEIDVKTYNYILNIFVNSKQPYSTIYKLSKEYSNINPIYLMTVLKRNIVVSEAISNSG